MFTVLFVLLWEAFHSARWSESTILLIFHNSTFLISRADIKFVSSEIKKLLNESEFENLEWNDAELWRKEKKLISSFSIRCCEKVLCRVRVWDFLKLVRYFFPVRAISAQQQEEKWEFSVAPRSENIWVNFDKLQTRLLITQASVRLWPRVRHWKNKWIYCFVGCLQYGQSSAYLFCLSLCLESFAH